MATHIPPQLWKLFASAVDDSISAQEMGELEHHLLGDPEITAAYERYCQLHIDLETQARGHEALQRFRSAHWIQELDSHAPARLVQSVAPRPIAPMDRPARRQLSMPGAWWLSAAAAAVFVGCIWLYQPEAPPFQTNIPVVTTVVTEDGATRIDIDGVGSVVVDNQSSFQILGPLRARLNNGRIEMHSTSEAARAFVVETPYGEVTELGRKFGMDVQQGSAGLVVFEGSVDLKLPRNGSQLPSQGTHRVGAGEGLSFDSQGKVDRIMAITTGTSPTYYRTLAADTVLNRADGPVIVGIKDNLRTDQTRRFYEIVPRGFRNDCLAYVDRIAHDWSGVDASGVPQFLLGADYIKTFNDDKNQQEIEISVTLSRPATLYVFLDDRVEVPTWLVRDWELTGAHIGLDLGSPGNVGAKSQRNQRSFVPGEYEERFTIWKRVVASAGEVTLGPNGLHSPGKPTKVAMYAIAAVALPEKQATNNQHP